MTIYVDVLIVLNIYVNYFLLLITAKISGSHLKPWRCVAASVYGSLFSLLILAPQLPNWVNTAIKLIAAATVVMIAFGICNTRRFLKNSAAFYITNFILAGGIYGAYIWLKPDSLHFSNSCFYIDFSLLLLIGATAAFYLLACIIRRLWASSPLEGYMVYIRLGERLLTFEGLADTGNCLVDFFTGKPVMICPAADIGELPKGTAKRLIPVNTVSGEGLMEIFRPDEVLISAENEKKRHTADVMIGLGETHGKAIFNPKNF